jgi:hypothetical protein
MDPNVALECILRGYLISDHAEALTEWLSRDGFAPADTTVPPVDPAAFVAKHCARHYPHLDRETILVRADKAGLWTAPPEGRPWISIGIWFDLCRMED